jgi:hypothetical protein
MPKVNMPMGDWESLIAYLEDHLNSFGVRQKPLCIPNILNDITDQVYSQEC